LKTIKRNREERKNVKLSGRTGRRLRLCSIGKHLPITRSGISLKAARTPKKSLSPFFLRMILILWLWKLTLRTAKNVEIEKEKKQKSLRSKVMMR
jgi:hypothetical protein